jgi:hypothetical protein
MVLIVTAQFTAGASESLLALGLWLGGTPVVRVRIGLRFGQLVRDLRFSDQLPSLRPALMLSTHVSEWRNAGRATLPVSLAHTPCVVLAF